MKKGFGRFEVFMTSEDEKKFSELLKKENSEINFIDRYPWPDPELSPRIRKSIDHCHDRLNSGALIWNSSIISAFEYQNKWIKKLIEDREEYTMAISGPGIIQFIHGKKAGYQPDGLRNASLTYSYDAVNDTSTDKFVKMVLKICKKNAKKLFTIDPKTGITSEKSDTRFFAWPDAVAKYDQVNGMYLTNNTMAYFTTKK